MFHKILYTDGFIFIADEMYQPDERKSLTDTGYLIALKAWKEILEWAETEQFFETGIGEPLGIQVFLSSKMLQKLEIDDASDAEQCHDKASVTTQDVASLVVSSHFPYF